MSGRVLSLYHYWTVLSAEDLRVFAGITGRLCDPDTEKVIARALPGDFCQVFIVDKRWNIHADVNPLGWQIASCGGQKSLEDAVRITRSAYIKKKLDSGEWPMTRQQLEAKGWWRR